MACVVELEWVRVETFELRASLSFKRLSSRSMRFLIIPLLQWRRQRTEWWNGKWLQFPTLRPFSSSDRRRLIIFPLAVRLDATEQVYVVPSTVDRVCGPCMTRLYIRSSIELTRGILNLKVDSQMWCFYCNWSIWQWITSVEACQLPIEEQRWLGNDADVVCACNLETCRIWRTLVMIICDIDTKIGEYLKRRVARGNYIVLEFWLSWLCVDV